MQAMKQKSKRAREQKEKNNKINNGKNISPNFAQNKSIFLFISSIKCESQKNMERAILKGSQFIVIYFKINSTIESIST